MKWSVSLRSFNLKHTDYSSHDNYKQISVDANFFFSIDYFKNISSIQSDLILLFLFHFILFCIHKLITAVMLCLN